MTCKTIAWALFVFLLAGCGDDGGYVPPPDTGTLRDSGPRDTGPADSGRDSGVRDAFIDGCVNGAQCTPAVPCRAGTLSCVLPAPICTMGGMAVIDTPCPGGVCDEAGNCLTGETTLLTAADAADFDGYGGAVDIDGDLAVVGTGTNAVGAFGDAAYVYRRQMDGTWAQLAKLTTTDATSGQFGTSVAIFGDFVLVGSHRASPGGRTTAGAAYLYQRQMDDSYMLVSRLIASDSVARQSFGRAVAINMTTLVVGAYSDRGAIVGDTGAAYVFENVAGTWTEVAKLVASDAGADDAFGHSVALDGARMVIGAHLNDTASGTDAGSAYVFENMAGTWTEVAILTASDAASNDAFGTSVSMSGGTAVVGSPNHNEPMAFNAGGVYVFTRQTDGTYPETARLIASDALNGDAFGVVDIHADRLIVGAPAKDRPFARGNTGVAYLFSRTAGAWTQTDRLFAVTTLADDAFGSGVAISGARAIIGAPGYDGATRTDSGGVYFFEMLP